MSYFRSKMYTKLSHFLDAQQERGRYMVTKDELRRQLRISEEALSRACHRLVEKKRLLMVRRGFYVIVPLEYRSSGTIPASWFIDGLMKYVERPYYVACLTAAAHYGAAHQRPQVFHVITDGVIPSMNVGGLRIAFFMKSSMSSAAVAKVKTPTGFMKVSAPATTALDLVRFEQRLGGLNRVAEVLQELADKITADALLAAAYAEKKMTYVQRLGHILDKLGETKITNKMAQWVTEQRPRVTSLKPKADSKGKPKDARWNVIVNGTIEVDA
jgi:predicted transcriptional regulator of viral defense system